MYIGYDPIKSINDTLVDFENPRYLAKKFNRVHCQNIGLRKIEKYFMLKKAAVVTAIVWVLTLM
jgi:hypothetical protein